MRRTYHWFHSCYKLVIVWISQPWIKFRNKILIAVKFQRIILAFKSHYLFPREPTSNTRHSIHTPRSCTFSESGYQMKHNRSCLIYYFKKTRANASRNKEGNGESYCDQPSLRKTTCAPFCSRSFPIKVLSLKKGAEFGFYACTWNV